MSFLVKEYTWNTLVRKIDGRQKYFVLKFKSSPVILDLMPLMLKLIPLKL